jgi:hypothetical protein
VVVAQASSATAVVSAFAIRAAPAVWAHSGRVSKEDCDKMKSNTYGAGRPHRHRHLLACVALLMLILNATCSADSTVGDALIPRHQFDSGEGQLIAYAGFFQNTGERVITWSFTVITARAMGSHRRELRLHH